MATLVARAGAKRLMSPDFLRAVSQVYSPTAGDHIKQAALARIIRLADGDYEDAEGVR